MVWNFIQNQLLGMKWLSILINNLLQSAGLIRHHVLEEVFRSLFMM